jgi:tRNA pseudouridine38-40 synthase
VELFNNLRKIVLAVEYNGRRYYGFQWQKGCPTVQDELEKAILGLTGERRRVSAACRTDTGVHARGQVVSFRTGCVLPPGKFVSGLNHYLPEDIAVAGAATVSTRFNVMKEAVSREYRYQIINRRPRVALENDMCYHVMAGLDAGLMDRAAGLLIESTISPPLSRDGTGRRVRCAIYDAEGREGEKSPSVSGASPPAPPGAEYRGHTGKVGTGKITIEEFRKILEMKKLSLAGPTAPAHGLCLMKVIYADNSEFKYENLCT